MKRIVKLLFISILFFSVVACDKTVNVQKKINQNISDIMNAEERIETVSDDCVGFLRIEINPVFELYVTHDESINELRVLGVRCINEDAELLFNDISVSNMTLYDAIYFILDAARTEGYLHLESNVKFEYFGDLQVNNYEEVLPITIMDYQKDKQVSFLYETSFTNITMTTANNSTVDDENLYDLVEKDEEGNIIKTVQTDSLGSIIDTCIYDKNGELVKRIVEDKNNKEYHEDYYENGKLIKTFNSSPIATRTEIFDENEKVGTEILEHHIDNYNYEKYYENGLLIKEHYCYSDRDLTTTFDEKGKVSTEILEHHIDNYNYEKYYENGLLIKEHYCYSDRDLITTFDEKGNMISTIIDNKETGEYHEENYDSYGNKLSIIDRNSEKNSYEENYWTYYENGNIATHICKCKNDYYTQELYQEEQYYRSGAIYMTYKVSQYGNNKFYYDESGNKTRYEGKDNYGNWVEIDY